VSTLSHHLVVRERAGGVGIGAERGNVSRRAGLGIAWNGDLTSRL
jgi:hypothetical protein